MSIYTCTTLTLAAIVNLSDSCRINNRAQPITSTPILISTTDENHTHTRDCGATPIWNVSPSPSVQL